ncbi:MAG: hypothetical protein MI861_16690 [Pirellulales bacterium]|nr:hypothetical protein [Pirellulales bacterium]
MQTDDMNWEACTNRILDCANTAIEMFAKEHPSEQVCSLYFYLAPLEYGRLSVYFNTSEHEQTQMKKLQAKLLRNREKWLGQPDSWKSTRYRLNVPVIDTRDSDPGGFKYTEYLSVDLPGIKKLVATGEFPQGADHDDDYVESNAILSIWQATERLVAQESHSALALASPFVIGYSFEDLNYVLRILNW